MSDEKFSDEGMVCPHCDHVHDPSGFQGYEYTDGEYDCDSCGESFDFSCFTSYSWTSVKTGGFEL